MQDLIWLVRNTLKLTFSKKSSWIVYVILPLVTVLFTFLLLGNSSGAPLRVGVVNLDGEHAITQDAITFVSGLNQTDVKMTDSESLRRDIATGKLDSGLIFEQGFAASVQEGKPANLQITSVKGAPVTIYVKSMLENYIGNVAAIGAAAAGDAGRFEAMYDHYKQASFSFAAETLKDTSKVNYMTTQSLGFLLLLMLFSAANMTHMILKEKENRTFLRLLSSPISARTYVLSNVVVSALVLLLQIVLALTFMKYIMKIDSGVPFGYMFTALALFLLAAIGLSLLIVAFSKNSRSANALQNLIITPTCLLAGCFFPFEFMPETVRKFAAFMPQRWLLDMIEKLQAGEAFWSLHLNMATLLAFAVLFTVIAIYRFSRNNDVRQFV